MGKIILAVMALLLTGTARAAPIPVFNNVSELAAACNDTSGPPLSPGQEACAQYAMFVFWGFMTGVQAANAGKVCLPTEPTQFRDFMVTFVPKFREGMNRFIRDTNATNADNSPTARDAVPIVAAAAMSAMFTCR